MNDDAPANNQQEDAFDANGEMGLDEEEPDKFDSYTIDIKNPP